MTKLEWIKKCEYWKNLWLVSKEQGNKLDDDSNGLNIYRFMDSLNENLKDDSCVVSDAGSSLYSCGQNLKLSKNQRWICSWAQAEMGAAISMGCGVSFAKNKGEVIVVTGDGSLNTQIHSLAIARKHNLPLKIFILQNFGYLSIKNSQDKFYEGRRIGTDSNDGIFFPNIRTLATAYKINSLTIEKINILESALKTYIMKSNEPIIIEVICQELQDINPAIVGKKKEDGKIEQCDFSDMFPHLSKEELEKQMIKD